LANRNLIQFDVHRCGSQVTIRDDSTTESSRRGIKTEAGGLQVFIVMLADVTRVEQRFGAVRTIYQSLKGLHVC
jgi:hypothetical protein